MEALLKHEVQEQTMMEKVISHGVTAYHAAAYGYERLRKAGFAELPYGAAWTIEPGGNYVLMPYPSMLVAVHIGYGCERGNVRIAAAHTDSPCLKLKPHPDMAGKFCLQLNVEPYGGMLKDTWFDRPLGIAGKLVLKGENVFSPKGILVDSECPVCVIPSLAPHLSRGNEKKDMNVQKEMLPIAELLGDESVMEWFCRKYQISAKDVLDYDLYLYNPEQPEAVGFDKEMISAPRIDNLASVAALLESMEEIASGKEKLKEEANPNIMIATMFDNEEIGSRSKQGADSVMLPQILDKLFRSLGIPEDIWKDRIAKGFLLSMDGAQGYHPNYAETSDPTNPVYLGKGIVIKTSASQRYLTDSEASAVLKGLCDEGQIMWQQQVNRSGMPGGQTLGPILSAVLPILGADIGIPMLAMHSARELAAWKDYQELAKLAKEYYLYV